MQQIASLTVHYLINPGTHKLNHCYNYNYIAINTQYHQKEVTWTRIHCYEMCSNA